MKRTLSLLVVGLLTAVFLLPLTSCGPAEIKGEISFASSREPEVDAALIAGFTKLHPGVKVTRIQMEEDFPAQFAALAAANKLPDVMYHYKLSSFATNGWLAPLDKLLANDPDAKDILPVALESGKYYGKQYALPYFIQFNCLVVNKDLLEKNNADVPAYDWTIPQFDALLKKFTTNKTNGINHLWGFEWDLTPIIDNNVGWLTYKDRKYDFTNPAYLTSIGLVRGWKAAGYASDDLVAVKATKPGFKNAYEEKFGVGVPAIDTGFTALGYIGTWDWGGWVRVLPFQKDLLPIPHPEGGKMILPMQTDYLSIASSTKNMDASYAFAKYLSFDPAGAQLTYETYSKLPIEKQSLLGPVTTNQKVLDAFNAVKGYPDGFKWMVAHAKDSYVADPQKRIPNWDRVFWEVAYPNLEKVQNGELNAADVVQEITTKGNAALAEEFAKTDTIMAKVQADYDAAQTKK
ncbi:MAG: extracellular solute-binding protein [Spirochaetales bacterium]